MSIYKNAVNKPITTMMIFTSLLGYDYDDFYCGGGNGILFTGSNAH